MKIQGIILPAFAALALAGCATTPPTPALVDARQEYQQANNGLANRYVPDRVYEARVALEKAEQAHEHDPGSEKEAHLAYVAHRKALIAEALAQQHVAHDEVARAKAEYQQVLVSQRDNAQTRLEAQAQKLTETTGELQSEKAAREKAESDYKAAMASLEEVGKVKAEQGRTTITISGEVLFATNKSELLPVARVRLDQVADALKDLDKSMTVRGYTDSRGTSAYNDDLSQRRAEAVRNYLIERGVPGNQLEAKGLGESRPIATNATAEGRANNRRVEIVIEDNPQMGGTSKGSSPEQQPED